MTSSGSNRPVRVGLAPSTAQPGDATVVIEPSGVDDGRLDHGALVGSIGPRDDVGRVPVEVVVDGWRFELLVEDAALADLRDRASRDRAGDGQVDGPLEIRAIIPGRIISVAVAVGDAVPVGTALLVVEAMKMQNELRAPRAGTVTRVAVGDGSTVDLGDLLVVLE